MKEKSRGGSLIGPLILIGLGVVFLLNNLGVLSWSVWDVIFRLWPVLLIAAGLDLLIGRRSALGSLVALALTLAVLAGALWLFSAGIGFGGAAVGEEVTQALDGATQARVIVEPGVGALHIEALPESANLVEGIIRVGRRQGVARDFAVKNGVATFKLRNTANSFGPAIIGTGGQQSWDLGLSPGVPLHVDVDLGVGEFDLDLAGLTVSDLVVNMGLGRTTVILPDEGRFEAKIESAIGETVVVVPDGMAVRVQVDTGLAASQLPGGYQRHDDIYTSPGYASADNRVDLKVSQAIGNVKILQSGPR